MCINKVKLLSKKYNISSDSLVIMYLFYDFNSFFISFFYNH